MHEVAHVTRCISYQMTFYTYQSNIDKSYFDRPQLTWDLQPLTLLLLTKYQIISLFEIL